MMESELNSLVDMEKDIISHPNDDLSYLDTIFKSELFSQADIQNINNALSIILNDEKLSQNSKGDILQNSWKINHKFKPPTVEEFLTEKWIGPQARDLYKHCKERFIEFFSPSTNKNKLTLYCCTGWGKSTFLSMAKYYRAVLTNSLRNPKQYLKLGESTRLTDVTISFTKATAFDLVVGPMVNILETSPMCERLRYERDMTNAEYTNDGKILFCNTSKGNSMIRIGDVYFDVASDKMDLIGRNIISASATELAFLSELMTEEKVMGLLDEMNTRVYNRFGYNNPNTTIVIDSSPNTMEGKIDQWISQHKNDKDMLYVNDKKWDVQPWVTPIWEQDHSKTFLMFKGTSTQPCRIINESEVEQFEKDQILPVPIDLLELAKDNASKILRDFGACPTAGSDSKLIQNLSYIENIFVPNLKNEISYIYADASLNPEKLLWDYVKKKYFIYTGKGDLYKFYRNPNAIRYCHTDLAKNHDMATFTMCHLENDKFGNKLYVIDFTLAVMAHKDEEINMDSFKYLVSDMHIYGGLPIDWATYDGFQSDTSQQYLKRIGINSERRSVDLDVQPYMSVYAYMQQGRLKVGKNIILKNNFKSLIKTTTKGGKGLKPKIDHVQGEWVDMNNTDWENSKMGYFGKDLSDSLVGAITNADLYGNVNSDYLYDYDDEKELCIETYNLEHAKTKIYEMYGLKIKNSTK